LLMSSQRERYQHPFSEDYPGFILPD
jgi:hypothetical protein